MVFYLKMNNLKYLIVIVSQKKNYKIRRDAHMSSYITQQMKEKVTLFRHVTEK